MAVNKKNLNSWSEFKGSEYRGDEYFVTSIVYSPHHKTGLTISTIGVEDGYEYYTKMVFRVIDMATGEMEHHTIDRYFEKDIELVTYYYLNETQWVLVTYDPNTYSYIQQLYGIKREDRNRLHIGHEKHTPVYAPSDNSGVEDFVTNPIEGCAPTLIGGKRYLVLPASTGLVLLLWNSCSALPFSKAKDDGIYIIFNSISWKVDEYVLFEHWFYTFGSKLYFSVSSQNAAGPLRDIFDRLAVLDLAGIDVKQKEVVLQNESVEFTMVYLKHKCEGQFHGMQSYRFSQRGKYVIATELKRTTDKSRSRPAVKSRVYVMNLERMETTMLWTRIREDCHVTMFNSSLLIWRSRFASNVKIEKYDEENEEIILSKVIHEYKTVAITGFAVPSLFSLVKNSLLFGRNGVTLPKLYVDRFF